MSIIEILVWVVAGAAVGLYVLELLFPGLMRKLARPMFGAFEADEFKKFLRMGFIFTVIIGVYWTLRPLKDSLFTNLVGAEYQPMAKIVSLFCLIPVVLLYTLLLNKFSREKMFNMLAWFYGIAIAVFGLLMLSPIGLAHGANDEAIRAIIAERSALLYYGTKILGFTWYVFIESFGSLVVALFWAIASDTTLPDSAKKGFPLVVAIGQFGGIVAPYFFTNFIPATIGAADYSDILTIFLCSITTFFLLMAMRAFLIKTPKELLVAYHGHGKPEEAKEGEQAEEPGFFEGLRLLLNHKYLLGIFAANFCFETLATIFDFHFKLSASMVYSGSKLTEYYGGYASSVNFVALLCLLLGVSNITRVLGVGVALVLVPLIMGGALTGFLTLGSLNFMFGLMVVSKAINYALNGPALKQLYIPTSRDAKFKAQAWIETFGTRLSKGGASAFNNLYKPLAKTLGPVAARVKHVAWSAYLGYGLVGLWLVAAFYLGKTYKKAIEEKKIVC